MGGGGRGYMSHSCDTGSVVSFTAVVKQFFLLLEHLTDSVSGLGNETNHSDLCLSERMLAVQVINVQTQEVFCQIGSL